MAKTKVRKKSNTVASVVIDGIFQKSKSGFIYVQINIKKKSPAAIKLTKETIYSEILLSLEPKTKLIKERKIKLSDYKKGDNVSIILQKAGSRGRTALAVRRVIIKNE